MINVEHIEELMFDYFEGNLSPEKMTELEAFIAENSEYQVDFDSWKDSYLKPEDQQPAFPYHALLAGSGGAWMKWLGLGIFIALVGIGSSALLSDTDTASTPSSKSNVDTAAPTHSVNYEAEQNQQLLALDHEKNTTAHARESTKTVISVPTTMGSKNNVNNNVSGSAGVNPLLNSPEGSEGSGWGASSNESQDKAKGAHQATKRKNTTKTRRNSSITAQAYNDIAESNQEGNKHFSFKDKSIHKKDEQYKDLALAQAVEFFDDGSGGGANQFAYKHTFPSLELPNRNSKKTGRESGLARLIHRLSNGILPTKYWGLRNYRDPYFLTPEYVSPLAQNAGYAGTGKGFRTELFYRNMANAHQANVSFDGRLGGKMKYGVGALLSQKWYSDANIQSNQTDINLVVSPKFVVNRHVTFEPSLQVNVGRRVHQFQQNGSHQLELERGRVLEVNNTIGGDSVLFTSLSTDYVDLGAGALLQASQFYVGVQVNNVLASSNSSKYSELSGFSNSPLAFTALLGTDYKYSDFSNVQLSPTLVFKQTGRHSELWLGGHAQIGLFMIGASYGNHGEATAMAGINTPKWRFSLGGDYSRRYLTGEKVLSGSASFRLFLGKKEQYSDIPTTQ